MTTAVPAHIADDLTNTLYRLREAREHGDLCLELVAENKLNRQLERVGKLLQRLNERSASCLTS